MEVSINHQTQKKQFHANTHEVIPKIRTEAGHKEIILGMDHNLDLLKSNSHQQTQQFLDIMMENQLLPSITRPTRITQQSATLIDNIFISEILQHNFDSAVIINDISDHLPIITMMKQTKVTDKTTIEFYSHKLTSSKIDQINTEIHTVNWNGVLNSKDCNVNFNVLCDILHKTMDKVAPLHHVRISGKR